MLSRRVLDRERKREQEIKQERKVSASKNRIFSQSRPAHLSVVSQTSFRAQTLSDELKMASYASSPRLIAAQHLVMLGSHGVAEATETMGDWLAGQFGPRVCSVELLRQPSPTTSYLALCTPLFMRTQLAFDKLGGMIARIKRSL